MGRISIVGTGYIGSVIAAVMASDGHLVTAIDIDASIEDKDRWFSRYNDVAEYIDAGVLENITTTTSYDELTGTLTIVCVDTPMGEDGKASLEHLKDACRRVGEHLPEHHAVVLKSTVPPGTSEDCVIPLLEEHSNMQRGDGFYYGYSPEFMRGGTGIDDFQRPPKTVVGGDDEAVDRYCGAVPDAERTFRTDIRTAEAVKYADNAFHALKIAFANEIGRFGEAAGFNGATVMDILQSDSTLNLSAAYLDPGASFGGPCLPKDLAALEQTISEIGAQAPVLSTIRDSNVAHDKWIEGLLDEDGDPIGVIGGTYKEGFNSVAQSPALRLVTQLEEDGKTAHLHAPNVKNDVGHVDIDTLLSESEELVVFHYPDTVSPSQVDDFDGNVVDLSRFNI